MKKSLTLLIAYVFFAALSHVAFAESFTGKVVRVSDGDTIAVLTKDQTQIKVRLSEIDAPEKNQPYGNKSKEAMSALVFGKTVTVQKVDTDRYGRTVGRVFVGDLDVNMEQVKSGSAWAYTQYLKDPKIKEEELVARNAKIGLWGLQKDQITPPWEWRKAHRKGNKHAR